MFAVVVAAGADTQSNTEPVHPSTVPTVVGAEMNDVVLAPVWNGTRFAAPPAKLVDVVAVVADVAEPAVVAKPAVAALPTDKLAWLTNCGIEPVEVNT